MQNITEIKFVLSHPQALGQCSDFIFQNLKEVTIIETSSTSEAAKLANEKGPSYAAIASTAAAELFRLNILAEQINDIKDNKTRFILLSRGITPPQKNNKTSVFFSVKNQPGSLVNVLSVFYRHNINLLYIESRPSRRKMGEYNFYADLEGHIQDENIQQAMQSLDSITNNVILTGSYPRFEN